MDEARFGRLENQVIELSKQQGELRMQVARADEQYRAMQRGLDTINARMPFLVTKDDFREANSKLATKDEIRPMLKIGFGIISSILIAVVGAVLALVFKGQ